MTLQEAKDQVAKEMGFPNWADYMTDHQGFEKVCELYARAKWDEACLEQRDRCVAQFINSPDVKVNQYSAREYCANAPKPEFQP